MHTNPIKMSELAQRIQQIPDLANVPLDQLEWLVEHSECRTFQPGEKIFDKGDPIDRLLIINSGRFIMRMEQNGQFRVLGHLEPGLVTGLLPYSRANTAQGVAEATMLSEVCALNGSHFPEMIREKHELTTALVHVMSNRVREFTKQRQRDDKMMSLGKLSAGLAHELNNPSAAVVRSAQELKKQLGYMPDKFKKVIKIDLSDEDVDRVNELVFQKLSCDCPGEMSLMERSALEDELMDWFDDNGLEDMEELAEVFAEFRMSTDDLDKAAEILRPEDLGPVIGWFGQVLNTEKLVNEIEEASQRIGGLVGSIKSYTHMDQAPERKATDLHVGIRNTLTMLGHKLRKGQIELKENFDEDLPHPKVFVSELNQVWTNLIDNAIDAMDDSDKKELEIETLQDGDFINILVRDSGKGIPEEVLENIFDPFFTTKAVGKGTGLGLDMVQQIITQHNGKVSVKSEPGETVFTVCIPIEQAA